MTYKPPNGHWRATRRLLGESGEIKAKCHCRIISAPETPQNAALIGFPNRSELRNVTQEELDALALTLEPLFAAEHASNCPCMMCEGLRSNKWPLIQ